MSSLEEYSDDGVYRVYAPAVKIRVSPRATELADLVGRENDGRVRGLCLAVWGQGGVGHLTFRDLL